LEVLPPCVELEAAKTFWSAQVSHSWWHLYTAYLLVEELSKPEHAEQQNLTVLLFLLLWRRASFPSTLTILI